MQNVERLSITLPADMARMIRDKVEQGRYVSNSEVIREAMRDWEEQERLRAQRAASRARIEEVDAETAARLSGAEVERHFAERLARIGGEAGASCVGASQKSANRRAVIASGAKQVRGPR